jgi:hypothetical protein
MFDASDGNAKRRKTAKNQEKWEIRKHNAAEGKGGDGPCRRAASVWPQHPNSCRDQQSSRDRRDPAENALNDSKTNVLKEQHAERKTNCPWYQQEAGDCRYCPDRSAKSCPGTNRDAHDVRPWHELTEAQNVSEFLLVYPSALLDGDSVRPDEPTTKSAERNLEECDEQPAEQYALPGFASSAIRRVYAR